MTLESKIKALPQCPGVYMMLDEAGRVLYVGKAKNLKVRVRNYIKPGADGRVHIPVMMTKARDLDWVVTQSEKEALILENSLIKKHRPRYNLDLRDDKTYLTLKITTNQEFPKLEATRRVKRDGAIYFGPYSSARDLHTTLELVNRIFPLRRCNERDFSTRERPCLYHSTSGCPAPCVGQSSKEDYREIVNELILFLKGRSQNLLARLEHEMQRLAEEDRFEEAALFRDRIRAVKATLERQNVNVLKPVDRDVIGLVREGGETQAAVLVVRAGLMTDKRSYYLGSIVEEDDAEVVGEFLRRYYRGDRIVPAEVVVPCELGEEGEFLASWLSERRGAKVEIIHPKRGERVDILKLANENAGAMLAGRRKSKVGFETALNELKERLSLGGPPRRIECFDVSNFQGAQAVASMSVLIDGMPNTQYYRRFSIKTVEGQDDFSMLYEVVTRRYAKKGEGWEWPDILVVDGGKGQLQSVVSALGDMKVELPCVIGLAKERTLPGEGDPLKTPERIFVPGRKNPIILSRNSPALFLLQRVRDEAHRFAIEYHRRLRARSLTASELLEIPGLGKNRKIALLKSFGSVKAIKNATLEDLQKVPGLPQNLALAIFEHFASNKS